MLNTYSAMKKKFSIQVPLQTLFYHNLIFNIQDHTKFYMKKNKNIFFIKTLKKQFSEKNFCSERSYLWIVFKNTKGI